MTEQALPENGYFRLGDYYIDVGEMFNTREGSSIGAKVGLFCTSEPGDGRGGYADFDWFRIEK